MAEPIPVDVLSDSDSGDQWHPDPRSDTVDLVTPPACPQSKKKQRTGAFSNPSNSTVFIIDDEPTPCQQKTSSLGATSSSTPSFVVETPSIVRCSRGKSGGSATEQCLVPDTPISELMKSDFSMVKCSIGVPSCDVTCSLISNLNSVETEGGLVYVESDNESETIGKFEAWKHSGSLFSRRFTDEPELESGLVEAVSAGTSTQVQKKLQTQKADKTQKLEGCSSTNLLEHDISLAYTVSGGKAKVDRVCQISSQQDNNGGYMKERDKSEEARKPKRISKEERVRLMEEKKQRKEQEKLLKAAAKAEAAELKRCQKEMQKWEKGKYALKSIVAEIDKKVVELGSVGGHLLSRFAEKGLSYRITSNPIERTILWTMVAPEEITVMASERIEISYVLIVYDAEEFCGLVMNESLVDHVQSIQQRYPHHTICYVTNRLMAYINKREQAQYKNPANYPGWKRPAIDEVLAKLATHFFKVHSRQCVDEAELADHVVGLTCSLASCQFRKRLTRLSVNANGSIIPKDSTDKNLIKKNLWLKALVAIPKVQPRFAIAIWKKYPTMKSLLSVYMDPTKSVHEKEFLLKDLKIEGLFGDDRRLGEVCSKRIYRILMAQHGNIKTDDVENGADFFSHLST